jgi:ATPase subunit of ABC transporter with duplicated ATPase domains
VEPVIEVSDLRKSYGDVERLHGISFTVEAERIFGPLGTNGVGKTTTIEILEASDTRVEDRFGCWVLIPPRPTEPGGIESDSSSKSRS